MIITNSALPFGIFPVPFIVDTMSPGEVTFNYNKQIQSTRNVKGWTFQHWGDKPLELEIKGVAALKPGLESLGLLAFFVLKNLYKLDKQKLIKLQNKAYDIATKATAIGALTYGAYQDFQNQRLSTENNGLSSATNAIQTAVAAYGLVWAGVQMFNVDANSELSTTYIYHDEFIYKGFFNSFNYVRKADQPRIINYSLKFTVTDSSEDMLSDLLTNKSALKELAV